MKSSVICFLKFAKLKYFKIVKSSKIKVPGTILKKYHITRLADYINEVYYLKELAKTSYNTSKFIMNVLKTPPNPKPKLNPNNTPNPNPTPAPTTIS